MDKIINAKFSRHLGVDRGSIRLVFRWISRVQVESIRIRKVLRVIFLNKVRKFSVLYHSNCFAHFLQFNKTKYIEKALGLDSHLIAGTWNETKPPHNLTWSQTFSDVDPRRKGCVLTSCTRQNFLGNWTKTNIYIIKYWNISI